MKIMADLDAVHLGLDENEADIAEELQDFDDSFDTRSEASESASDSSDSQPSISSVSTAESSIGEKRNKTKPMKKVTTKENEKKAATKRTSSPGGGNANGKKVSAVAGKKKRSNVEAAHKVAESSNKSVESKTVKEKKTIKKLNTNTTIKNSSASSTTNINGPANTSSGSISTHANTSGNKSDISDAEDNTITKDPFDSDSESEDSDSAANIKRNGARKAISKSASPEKKLQGGGAGANASGKSYDYMTKLNYLFRGTHFFLIKSNNADNVAIAKNKNIWATLPQNEANLNQAFKESRNVLLIFSVNESGKFAGFARMGAQSRRDLPHPAWVLPPSISPKALGGIIELDWICRKELSFNCTSHLYNTWNESKPVKIGRDGQEIEPKVGAELCRLFPEDEKIEMTPILRKSKEAAKLMREKGVRVSYRPPRSLSTRGSRGGGGGSSVFPSYRQGDRRIGSSGSGGGGPIRHRRGFGIPPHRPYKLPPLGMPPGSFKRSSSPYRSGGGAGSGSSGGSRSGGGDAGLPSWDRYMNSAEVYMMDYMRSMHGQLPPLPFVPPFAQLPLSASGVAGLPPPGPPSMYDQLPPPVRYYDGPPLPDYPPPQPIRPPPPGFDKAPSYEDFAAWKNAGLPTLPEGMPPGFPNFSSSGTGPSASNGGGSSGLGGSSSTGGGNGSGNSGGGSSSFSSSNNAMNTSNTTGGGPNSFRSSNQRPNTSNMMRPRERAGGRDYRGPSSNMNTSRSGGNDRHFRPGGASSGGGARNYREGRR